MLTNVRENGLMTSLLTRTGRQESRPFRRKNGRTEDRYNLRMPLRYRTADHPPQSWKRGCTLEISSVEIVIDIPEALAVNTKVELSIDWPGLYHGTDMMNLWATGFVTQVDQGGTG